MYSNTMSVSKPRHPTAAAELHRMHKLAARLIHAALCDDYEDVYLIKEVLFGGCDEETFNAIVEQGREIKTQAGCETKGGCGYCDVIDGVVACMEGGG